jgi:hypothetical protein
VQEKNSKDDQIHEQRDDHEYSGDEPNIEKKVALNSVLAGEMQKGGIACEALEIGSHAVERRPYYSYIFPLSSRMVTNKGLIRISGRYVDLVQVLQRN